MCRLEGFKRRRGSGVVCELHKRQPHHGATLRDPCYHQVLL